MIPVLYYRNRFKVYWRLYRIIAVHNIVFGGKRVVSRAKTLRSKASHLFLCFLAPLRDLIFNFYLKFSKAIFLFNTARELRWSKKINRVKQFFCSIVILW